MVCDVPGGKREMITGNSGSLLNSLCHEACAAGLRTRKARRLSEPCRSLGEGGASFGASGRKPDVQAVPKGS